MEIIQNFSATLLIFIRCELAARVYFSMRELALKSNFASSQFMSGSKDSIKPENSITSLIQDLRKIHNLLHSDSKFSLRSDWVYWMFSQTHVLSLKLFAKFIRFLPEKLTDDKSKKYEKQVDEVGL